MEPLILTDAQRLNQGYCGLIQRKSTVKHTIIKRRHTHTHTHTVLTDEWTDRQTECRRADKLLAPGGKQP